MIWFGQCIFIEWEGLEPAFDTSKETFLSSWCGHFVFHTKDCSFGCFHGITVTSQQLS